MKWAARARPLIMDLDATVYRLRAVCPGAGLPYNHGNATSGWF